jgi:hypothetical protein
MSRIEIYQQIVGEMEQLYIAKNADYGNSVGETFNHYGLVSFLVRLEDKLNRLRTLNQKEEAAVKDEKIEDTLQDLANYAILALIELKLQKEEV